MGGTTSTWVVISKEPLVSLHTGDATPQCIIFLPMGWFRRKGGEFQTIDTIDPKYGALSGVNSYLLPKD